MKTITMLIASIAPITALANGGGYVYGNSKMGSLGLFQPKNAEQVEMQTELLDIELGIERAKVSVEYTLHNPGKAVTVEAGFPISRDGIQKNEEGKIEMPKEALRNFTAKDGDEPVKWKLQWDKRTSPDGLKIPMENPSLRVSGWHVFKLAFKAGESKTFRVSYEAPYSGSSWSVSEDASDSVEKLPYLFSTASVWKGPIKSGKVVVRAVDVDPEQVKFNLAKRFKRAGNVWTWEFTDFEPTLADDLSIAVHPESQSWGRPLPEAGEDEGGGPRYVDYVKELGKWEMRHRLYKATATSTLAPQGENSYDAQNVAGLGGTAWAEGAKDDGIGESLTLDLQHPRKISRIGICNGYIKHDGDDTSLYFANGRVAEFAVSVNGGKSFTASIPDEPLLRRLFYVPLPADTEPVKTIKLTIQKVYPGSKYHDTCVSSVELVTPLEKAPKITPAR